MRNATASRLSAGTPKTIGPVAGSWDEERFAERFLTAHAELDSPGRLVHNRPRPGRSSERESGWCSTSAGSLAVSSMKINCLRHRWDFGEAQPSSDLLNRALQHPNK